MSVMARVAGLGLFELEYQTVEYPTPEPGADPWIVEIEWVQWLVDCSIPLLGVEVGAHARQHMMPDGATLDEHLERWVYDHEVPEFDDYLDDW